MGLGGAVVEWRAIVGLSPPAKRLALWNPSSFLLSGGAAIELSRLACSAAQLRLRC